MPDILSPLRKKDPVEPPKEDPKANASAINQKTEEPSSIYETFLETEHLKHEYVGDIS